MSIAAIRYRIWQTIDIKAPPANAVLPSPRDNASRFAKLRAINYKTLFIPFEHCRSSIHLLRLIFLNHRGFKTNPPGIQNKTPGSSGANVSPQEGSRCLVLSAGNAQMAGQAGYAPNTGFEKGYSNLLPTGFPAPSASCPSVTYGEAYDGIALEAVVRVPRYAAGFLFDY